MDVLRRLASNGYNTGNVLSVEEWQVVMVDRNKSAYIEKIRLKDSPNAVTLREALSNFSACESIHFSWYDNGSQDDFILIAVIPDSRDNKLEWMLLVRTEKGIEHRFKAATNDLDQVDFPGGLKSIRKALLLISFLSRVFRFTRKAPKALVKIRFFRLSAGSRVSLSLNQS